MTYPVIDAHQHVWDPARAEYEWLGSELAPINRRMTFADVAAELRAARVDYTVLVQSADNAQDTELMRETAAINPQVVGIVGFAPLDDPEATATTLDSWRGDSRMVGVRNLIHTKSDPDWLLQPAVAESLSVLEDRGLVLDIPAVAPRHLEVVAILSQRHPFLRIVIDHLGKPPIGHASLERWRGLLSTVAQNPLVHAKVSGLYPTTGDPAAWTTETIRPAFDRAVELFGPQRLLYGGDWPISVLAGGYTRVWAGLRPLFDSLSAEERQWILGRTAVHVYELDRARIRPRSKPRSTADVPLGSRQPSPLSGARS